MKNVNSSVNYVFKYVCTVCDFIMCGQMVSWRGGVVLSLRARWGGSQEVPVPPLYPLLRACPHTHTHTLNLMAVCVCVCVCV